MWPNEQGQKNKQRSKNMAQKTKDRGPRILLETGDNIRYPRGVAASATHLTPVMSLLNDTNII